MTSLKWWALSCFLLAAVVAAVGPWHPRDDRSAANPDEAARRSLAEQLKSAYPTASPASRVTRTFELTAAPTSVQHFDGRLLDVWAYNDRVPGAVLRVRLGDSVEVTLHNRLPQATTIHWYGGRFEPKASSLHQATDWIWTLRFHRMPRDGPSRSSTGSRADHSYSPV